MGRVPLPTSILHVSLNRLNSIALLYLKRLGTRQGKTFNVMSQETTFSDVDNWQYTDVL
jgi:hypothetical protein